MLHLLMTLALSYMLTLVLRALGPLVALSFAPLQVECKERIAAYPLLAGFIGFMIILLGLVALMLRIEWVTTLLKVSVLPPLHGGYLGGYP